MRALRKLAAWILGSVLFLAGVLKLMDPTGAGLIVAEYFKFFGFAFLSFSSKTVGVALALFESVLGAAAITGVWRKVVAAISLVVLASFTIITAILWIANPNMDCGCFGEAIHLSHAWSFLKNVILLGLWALAYLPFHNLLPTHTLKYVAFGIVSVLLVGFMLMGLGGLPMIDFTPFSPGTELCGQDEPYTDDAPVLSFYDSDSEYCDSLALASNVLIVSAYEPLRISGRVIEGAVGCLCDAQQEGLVPVFLAGCTPAGFEGTDGADALREYAYFADRRTLMTLNRSNGGATLLRDGQIICKWPSHRLPDAMELSELVSEDATTAVIDKNGPQRIKLQAFVLFEFALMLLL